MKSRTKVFFALLLAVTIAFGGFHGHANAQTEYNLLMGDRLGAPYASLPRFTLDLKNTGTNPKDFPVEVTRHHIVPFNQLRELWNQMVRGNYLTNSIGSLKSSIAILLSQAPSEGGINLNQKDREDVNKLLDDILSKRVQHKEGKPTPVGWDSFQQVYTWIPGNLFIGPSVRSDDPGEGFEGNASVVVNNQTKWKKLDDTNQQIDEFRLSPSAGKAQNAVSTYSSIISQQNEPFPLDPKHWLRDGVDQNNNPRYRLNKK